MITLYWKKHNERTDRFENYSEDEIVSSWSIYLLSQPHILFLFMRRAINISGKFHYHLRLAKKALVLIA